MKPLVLINGRVRQSEQSIVEDVPAGGGPSLRESGGWLPLEQALMNILMVVDGGFPDDEPTFSIDGGSIE